MGYVYVGLVSLVVGYIACLSKAKIVAWIEKKAAPVVVTPTATVAAAPAATTTTESK